MMAFIERVIAFFTGCISFLAGILGTTAKTQARTLVQYT